MCLPPSHLPFTPSSPVSKQRGAPKPDPTQKVMRKRGTTSVKVNNHNSTKSQKELQYLLHWISYVASLPSLIPTFLFIPAALRRQQDGGFFKSPHYPGYPFLMIPDLTNPYLSNGSLSPSARTVSVLVYSVDTLFLIFVALARDKKKTLAVRKSSLRTARPPYSPPTGLSRSSNYFFVL